MWRPDDGAGATGEPRPVDVETAADKAPQAVDATTAAAAAVADDGGEEDEDEDEHVRTAAADGGVLLTDTLKSMGADTVISMARAARIALARQAPGGGAGRRPCVCGTTRTRFGGRVLPTRR